MRAPVAAHPSRRPLRRPGAGVAAGLAAAGLLAGCTGGGTAPAAAGAPREVASPAAATTPADAPAGLARGLLPADAFGPGATVVPVSLAQLQQRLAAVPGGLGAALAGTTVTPSACASALQASGAGLAGLTDLAGEGARTGRGGTAEALVTGAPVDSAVGALTGLASACPHVAVTSPHGSATVDLAALPAPALGDGATAVRVTAVLTPAGTTGRAPVTVSALLAAVRDGDRLLLLGTAAPGAPDPDPDTFTSLLQRAYATAHAAR